MSEKEQSLGLVIYGDGSARPNPGYTGSGFHAYTYSLDDTGEKTDKSGEYFTTDNGYQKKKAAASDRSNGEITGKPVKPIDYYDGAVPNEGVATNNFAELNAIYEGLRQCWDKSIKKLRIICDSEYVLNCLRKNMATWAKSGWVSSTGSPISNLETIKELHYLVSSIKDAGVEISVAWVRGHMEIAGNTHADMLSNIARVMGEDNNYRPKVLTLESKKYTDYTVEKHPFITHKRLYFITKPEQNIPGFYMQGDSGAGDFMIGKRLPETGYSVVILNEPDEMIEMLKTRQYDYATGLTQISSLLLDRAFDKKVYRYIDNFGKYCFEKDKRNTNINFFDGKPISMVMNPTGLSIRAIDCFNFLATQILRTYITNKETIEVTPFEDMRILATDITTTFFDMVEKKVGKEVVVKPILKKDFAVGMKNLIIDHEVSYHDTKKTVKIPIIFGTDIPDRNQIKRLEPLNPKIKLITWRHSEDSMNYAVIIDCDNAVGIWSNFYADQIIICNQI